MLRVHLNLQRHRFDLSAEFQLDGGVTGIFGRSGSGKSTLLSLIAGLSHAQQGRIELDGRVLFDSQTGICLPPHQRHIGLVFQDSQLFPHYSVRGNLNYGASRAGAFRFDDIVDLLELAPLLQAKPRQLSGGERQRVALGRSLLASPRWLLLDEPLAALDQGLKAQILPFLLRIKQALDLPMLYVSHSLAEIAQLTDQLLLVNAGRLTAHGTLHQLAASGQLGALRVAVPDNLWSATLHAHAPDAACSIAYVGELSLQVPLRPHSATGQRVYLALAAGEIALARAPVIGTSIQNQIAGLITDLREHHDAWRVTLDAAGVQLIAEVSQRARQTLELCVGQSVYALIKARSFRYLSDGWEGDE